MDRLQSDSELIASSGLFDRGWYTTTYPDVVALGLDPVEHFLRFGADLLRNPGSTFDTAFYLEQNPDVAAAGINPLVHYITFGIKEGRVCNRAAAVVAHTARPYKDFSGFLSHTLLSPVVNAPFVEEDKRCFAVMDNIARYLAVAAARAPAPPLVSVIMPVHNRADLVGEAIASVLAQEYAHFELIIVDDGSTDGTGALLATMADPRIVLLRNEHCSGSSHARNRGLQAARGSIFAYLDSDNQWDSRYLAAMAGAFLTVPSAQAAYSGQFLFRGQDTKPFAARFGSLNRALLQNRNYIDLNAFCHTRAAFEQAGGFDEVLCRYVDWDLIMRMAHAVEMISVPVLLSHYFYDKADNTVTNDPTFVEQHQLVRAGQLQRAAMRMLAARSASQASLRPVTIVIPSYQALADLRECIDSILALDAGSWITPIVVDNASAREVRDYLDALAAAGQIKLIKNEANVGFTFAVNQGIAHAAEGSDIVLLNNDAVLTPDAIVAMQQAAYSLPECAMVVPQQVLPPQTRTMVEHVPYANPEYACDVNLSVHHRNVINLPLFHKGEVVELSFAPFFCVYIKREILDRSLGLDAELGRHYRSDRIFCDYVRHVMGLRIYQLSSAVVHHKLQKSTACLQEAAPEGQFDDVFSNNRWNDRELREHGFRRPVWDQ